MAEATKRGSNGGNARAEKLTKEQRSAIAKNAAAKRWAKPKDNPKPLIDPETTKFVDSLAVGIKKSIDDILQTNRLKTDADVLVVNSLHDAPVLISGQEMQSPFIYKEEPPTAPPPTPPDTFTPPGGGGHKRCFACFSGQPLDSGRHILGTVDHPVGAVIAPIAPPQEVAPSLPSPSPQEKPQKALKRPARPMPKEFKGASSYADKRLAEAIKERAESMGKVAALNAEIPSLVAIIRALGGTPNIGNGNSMMAYPPMDAQFQAPAQQAPYQYPNPPVFAPQGDPLVNQPPSIDPNLYAANSGPLPGLVPAAKNAPLIPNTSLGGAMDLDYAPEVEEQAALPRMGGGWI